MHTLFNTEVAVRESRWRRVERITALSKQIPREELDQVEERILDRVLAMRGSWSEAGFRVGLMPTDFELDLLDRRLRELGL